MLGLNIRSITRFYPRYLAILPAFAAPIKVLSECKIISPTIYFDGHVGPFSVYPTAAYAITVATSRDKLAMPKWRNNILVQAPGAPDDHTVAALRTTVVQHGRAILLFPAHAGFKDWQLLLAQVLA